MRYVLFVSLILLLLPGVCFGTEDLIELTESKEMDKDSEDTHRTDINQPNTNGDTTLMLAAWKGYLSKLNQEVHRGADVNCVNKDGGTALLFASWQGHADVVDKLLSCGAEVNHTDKKGNSALILASWNGHAQVIESLLARGARVHYINNHGNTALKAAVLKNHRNVIEKLQPYDKESTHDLISGFKKLPPEMRMAVMKYTIDHSKDKVDILTLKFWTRITAEQLILLYLLKVDSGVVIEQWKSTASSNFHEAFYKLPDELKKAVIEKYYHDISISAKDNNIGCFEILGSLLERVCL